MPSEKTICLHGGPMFDGKRLVPDGAVLFSRKRIIRTVSGPEVPPAHETYDVNGRLIAPGLVDLHSDALEKCIEVRPGVIFDAEFALQNLDRRVAACGITTFCHALSFADNEFGLRSPEEAEKLVALIHKFSGSNRSSLRHKVHARFEIGSIRSADILARLIDAGRLDLLSFMDHTPGQGQFKSLQSFMDYFTGTYRLDEKTVLETVERKKSVQAQGWKQAARLALRARKAGIPILSHDDDTREKVHLGIQLGVTACEFPVSMEAVQTAKENGLKIFMGAPNLMRNRSTNGHIKASETVLNRTCSGFVSDYYPECMVQTPFIAHRRHKVPLAEALRYATAEPGAYFSADSQKGTLSPNLPADVVVIDTRGDWPAVTQTWVNGECVYRSR